MSIESYVISLVNKNSFTDSLPNNLKSLSFEETLALQNRMSKKKAITFDGFDDKWFSETKRLDILC